MRRDRQSDITKLVANFAKGARNRHYEHLINEPESEPTKQLKHITSFTGQSRYDWQYILLSPLSR
jgi:hypothetical protein